MKKQSMFDAIGSLTAMERIHTAFYDKVYAHPWLGQFFVGHDQQAIELHQTQFMAEKMGAKSIYPGRELPLAHRRMYITEELLTLRQGLLRDSVLLLDMREPGELQTGFLPGALNIPRRLLELKADLEFPMREPKLADRDQAIVIYCASGGRSLFSLSFLFPATPLHEHAGWTH